MRGWWWVRAVALGAALVVGVSGCGSVRPTPPPVVNGVQVGTASWYGPGFHGNRTANGEIYDQYELTAAHPTLPLGTRVMVTNLTNGRSVEVRINDRGPYVDGRAIDLSYAAARMVGMIGPGTARVRIELLRAVPIQVAARESVSEAALAAPVPVRMLPPPVNDLPRVSYLVQIASLSDPVKAEHLRGVLSRRFPEAHVSRLPGTEGQYYRVRIGPYPLRGVALARAEMVNRSGYPAIIMEEPAP